MPHAEASLQFLGFRAKRVRTRWRTELSHLDLVHEGWLGFQEAVTQGFSGEKAYRFAETRMETCVEREDRARRPHLVDHAKGVRRLTPGDWHALETFVRRVLGDAPALMETMLFLFQGRSIEEVSRERGVTRSYAYQLRSKALRRLTAVLGRGQTQRGRPRREG